MLRSILVHGDELVENVIVGHEQHRRVSGVALYAKESLAGIIGLHVVHVWRRDELLILWAIGRESDATMEEHFQVGPHFFEVFLATQLHDAHQHRQHP